MQELLFAGAPARLIPISGMAAAYPIHRIFCVGRNYLAHAAEMGLEADREAPFYFTKNPLAAIATGSTIPYPPGTSNLHHEMELAIALGSPAFRVAAESALGAVFGYCCALDMTRRDLQQAERVRQRPWDLGKDFENSAVFAPIMPAAEFGTPGSQRIHLSVNGQIRQDARLSEMIHGVPSIISHLSRFYHLGPGDVILTGTPAGVGPVAAGDRMEGGIDGLEPISLSIGPAE